MAEAPRVDWRKLRGGDTRALPAKPRPPFLGRRSTSEGDMARGSYRESQYDDHFTKAICNDDGSPVTAEVVAVLLDILDEFRALRAQMSPETPEGEQ